MTPSESLQMDDLLSRLSMAKDKISDTEDLISIDLDHRREAARLKCTRSTWLNR